MSWVTAVLFKNWGLNFLLRATCTIRLGAYEEMGRSILGVLYFALYFCLRWAPSTGVACFPLPFPSIFLYFDLLRFHWIFSLDKCLMSLLPAPHRGLLSAIDLLFPCLYSSALLTGFTHTFSPVPYFYPSHFLCPLSSPILPPHPYTFLLPSSLKGNEK